ncbi:MAG: glycoside hydrolase family 31 protein, partial [Chloroflexi bacterium]|nr:glycoside hydrolase family 31 protein [Chloroflexota bacterium]
YNFARYAGPAPSAPPLTTYLNGAMELVTATVTPNGEQGPDGPLGTLRTIWRATRKLEGQPRPRIQIGFRDGSTSEFSDFAALWWYPPERWRVGELVKLDLDGLPLRQVAGWQALVPPPASAASARPASLPEVSDEERFKLGDLTVAVRRSPWRMSVLGPTGALIWQESDPVPGDRHGPLGFQVDGQSWWHLTSLLGSTPVEGGFELRAATDDPSGRTATVRLESLGPADLRVTLEVSDPGGITAVSQSFPSPQDERFVGFGERFTGVDQRGRVVTTWANDRRAAGYGDSTYAPVPFFISNHGYSMLLETDARSTYDLASEKADRASWEVATAELSLVFGYGPSPRELVQRYVTRSGLPPLPPLWSFGVVKTAIGGQEQVLRDAQRLRELDVPVSGIYAYDAHDDDSNIGWPYVTYTGKQAGPYPDLRAFTDELHRRGFKALAYNTADFHLGTPAYQFPANLGFFIRGTDGRPYLHQGYLISWIDFTNPGAVNWWGLLWRRALGDLGFDGGMLDLGELTPEDAVYANGQTGQTMHNRYPALYHQAALNAARAVKPDALLFARAGGPGAQAYQLSQWSGDPVSNWTAVEGFKSIVPAALSFGLSGFPYFHTEVGGYLAADIPHQSEYELWMRWLQVGAFTSMLRDQYGDHQTGTQPVEIWSDENTMGAFRFYAGLHNQLVPYIYSYAKIASETGLPIMRHLALNWPDQPRAWQEEQSYTLGDDILVAPVVDEGARLRRVYLPPGGWVDFWTGQLWDGDREITADAPVERLPVFVRAGAILPMATDFDTLAPASVPGVRSWNGDLVVKVMSASEPVQSVFRLYDGTQLAYRSDERSSEFTRQNAGATVAMELHLPSTSAPAQVLVDGASARDWRFERGEVVLSLPTGASQVRVVR